MTRRALSSVGAPAAVDAGRERVARGLGGCAAGVVPGGGGGSEELYGGRLRAAGTGVNVEVQQLAGTFASPPMSTVPWEQSRDSGIGACIHGMCGASGAQQGPSRLGNSCDLERKAQDSGLEERTRERCAREECNVSGRFCNILACALDHGVLDDCAHAMRAEILSVPPQEASSRLLPYLQKTPLCTPFENHPLSAVPMHL